MMQGQRQGRKGQAAFLMSRERGIHPGDVFLNSPMCIWKQSEFGAYSIGICTGHTECFMNNSTKPCRKLTSSSTLSETRSIYEAVYDGVSNPVPLRKRWSIYPAVSQTGHSTFGLST